MFGKPIVERLFARYLREVQLPGISFSGAGQFGTFVAADPTDLVTAETSVGVEGRFSFDQGRRADPSGEKNASSSRSSLLTGAQEIFQAAWGPWADLTTCLSYQAES